MKMDFNDDERAPIAGDVTLAMGDVVKFADGTLGLMISGKAMKDEFKFGELALLLLRNDAKDFSGRIGQKHLEMLTSGNYVRIAAVDKVFY